MDSFTLEVAIITLILFFLYHWMNARLTALEACHASLDRKIDLILAELTKEHGLEEVDEVEEDIATTVEEEENDEKILTVVDNDKGDEFVPKKIPSKVEKRIKWTGAANETTIQEIFTAFGLEEAEDGSLTQVDSIQPDKPAGRESPLPWMWEYDGSRLPMEFESLDPATFVQNPDKLNFCIWDKDILIRICSMLAPPDFINLSLMCRFLHWRMFAYCRCHVPYTAVMTIFDSVLDKRYSYDAMPAEIYSFISHPTREYPEENGFRGIFVFKPDCLKKPFFFDTLEVTLTLPFYDRADYKRCQTYILPLRKFAKHLKIVFDCTNNNFNYGDTNDFFEALEVSSYLKWDNGYRYSFYDIDNIEIYRKCPYVRKMSDIWVHFHWSTEPETIWPNPIGYYGSPNNHAVIDTITRFSDESLNLLFHVYYGLRGVSQQIGQHSQLRTIYRFPIIEGLLRHFKIIEEYYSEKLGFVWYLDIGSRNRMRITRDANFVCILIGKKAIFNEMEERYMAHYHRTFRFREYPPRIDNSADPWWKMETAIHG